MNIDQPRSRKPAVYGPEVRSQILSHLEQPPPQGLARWDGGTLAQVLGVSDDIVCGILRKEGIQLARRRSWCVSTDPEFTRKAADIIGLYLDPPTHAMVLSVDEKPAIQAIEVRIPPFHVISDRVRLRSCSERMRCTVVLTARLSEGYPASFA